MDEVALLPAVTPRDADRSTLTRLNARYEPLLNLARLFLDHSTLQLSSGDVNSFAFVFDMNRLFEGFLAGFIRRELADVWRGRGWTMKTQSAGIELLRDRADRPHVLLRPDIRFEAAGGNTVLLIDTKYKRLDPVGSRYGMSEGDAYQMFAYARRYQCPRVVLLYPHLKRPLRLEFATGGGPYWLGLRTIRFDLDLSRSDDRLLLQQGLGSILVEEVHDSWKTKKR